MNTLPRKTANVGFLVNQALLRLVKQYGQASYSLLFDQYGDVDLSANYANTRFANKLGYLCQTEQLQRSGFGHKAMYTLGPRAFKSKYGTAPVQQPQVVLTPVEAAGSYLVSKALPNQYDVMRAPQFTPPPATVLRPGALNYQRYASHGDRC